MWSASPTVFDDELRDQDSDLTVRMLALDLQDVLDERHDNEAIGRGEKSKLWDELT